MTLKSVGLFLILTTAVIGLSILSVELWDSRPEEFELEEITIASETAPIATIAESNHIPLKVITKALGITEQEASASSLTSLGITVSQAQVKIKKSLIVYYEEQSKSWRKIFVKFLLWFLILPIPVILIARRKMTPKRRWLFYVISLTTFGIILGSDISPMGTVKDAVFLISAHQTIFWPRIIALAIFLLTVVLSTKLICSWGCQFGTLQDAVFRIGRNKRDRKGSFKQIKPPFWLSNTVRVLVFLFAVAAGILWTLDIVGLVDPFRIYKPLVLGIGGALFILGVLVASLFIYRPWCHFACPFGLVSWLFEKLAIFRIKVDYSKCDACQACNSACPSTVMDAILKKDRVIPDCFGCGVCVESCPTNAVTLTSSRKYTGDYSDAIKNLEMKKNRLSK